MCIICLISYCFIDCCWQKSLKDMALYWWDLVFRIYTLRTVYSVRMSSKLNGSLHVGLCCYQGHVAQIRSDHWLEPILVWPISLCPTPPIHTSSSWLYLSIDSIFVLSNLLNCLFALQFPARRRSRPLGTLIWLSSIVGDEVWQQTITMISMFTLIVFTVTLVLVSALTFQSQP